MMKPANELSLANLCSQPVDFRKGMLGLSALVEANLSLNPFAETLFVFCNRQRSGIKMLYWQRNGFCLWQILTGFSFQIAKHSAKAKSLVTMLNFACSTASNKSVNKIFFVQ
jgi:transposase